MAGQHDPIYRCPKGCGWTHPGFHICLTQPSKVVQYEPVKAKKRPRPQNTQAALDREARAKRNSFIADAYRKGTSIADIASEIGTSPESCYGIVIRLIRKGVIERRSPYNHLKNRNEEILSAYLAGEPVSILAEKYDMKAPQIRRILVDTSGNKDLFVSNLGVLHQSNAERNTNLVEDFKNGICVFDLHRKYKITVQSVNKILGDEKRKIRETLAAERDEKVVRLYAGGTPVMDIAKDLKIGSQTIRKILHSAAGRGEVRIRSKGSPYKDLSGLVEKYAEGTTIRELEIEYHITGSKIREILREAQDEGRVRIRGKNERRKPDNSERDERIIRMYRDEGLSSVKIVKALRSSDETVRGVLHAAAAEGKLTMRSRNDYPHKRS